MVLTITLNPAVDKVYAIDDYTVGGIFRPRDMTVTAGGKGLNVARVARLLGAEVTATGFAGGNAGRFIQSEVAAAGIESRFVTIGGETRSCVAVMDRERGTSTEILEPGPTVTLEECDAFLVHYAGLASRADIVAASGSLPLGIPEDFYRTLAGKAKSLGKRFILDTSGTPLAEGLEAAPYMVKPNLEELEVLLGRSLGTRVHQAAALLRLRGHGIELPCLTLGKDGCLASLPGGVYHFYAPPIQVLNTVGSGDAFVAGCAVALLRGLDHVAAVKLGMACGLANTQFFQTGLISPELVEGFGREIEVARV